MPTQAFAPSPNPFAADVALPADGRILVEGRLVSPAFRPAWVDVVLYTRDDFDRSISEVVEFLGGHRVLLSHQAAAPFSHPRAFAEYRLLVEGFAPKVAPASAKGAWGARFGLYRTRRTADLRRRVDSLFAHLPPRLDVDMFHGFAHALLWDFPHPSSPEPDCPDQDLHSDVVRHVTLDSLWMVCPLSPLDLLLENAAAIAEHLRPSPTSSATVLVAEALERYPLEDATQKRRFLAAKLLRGGVAPRDVLDCVDDLLT